MSNPNQPSDPNNPYNSQPEQGYGQDQYSQPQYSQPYGPPPPNQPQYGPPYGYGPPPPNQPQYGPPYGPPPPNQPPYGPPPPNQPYGGQPPYGPPNPNQPYGYGPPPYGQQPYGQAPHGAQMPPVYGGMQGYVVPVNAAGSLATVGRRFGAYLLDALILGFAMGLLGLFTGLSNLANPTFFNFNSAAAVVRGSFWISLVSISIYFAYYTYFYSTNGQTIGKRAVGIRVIRRDNQPLDWNTGLRRTIIILLPSLISTIFSFVLLRNLSAFSQLSTYSVLTSAVSLFSLLDYLWAFWDIEKQTLHDKLANTVVVYA